MNLETPDIRGSISAKTTREWIERARALKPLLEASAAEIETSLTIPDHVLDALHDVYSGGSPMTSNIARKIVQSFHPVHEPADPGQALSTREEEVLDMLTQGFLFKEVADRLNISVHTVNTYVRRIYEKLHVQSRAQAVAKYAHSH